MAELFVIGIGLFLFVLLGTIYVATQRYKLAPSDQILVVYGNVKDKQSAECIHGGGKIVWPLIQHYAYLSLRPMTLNIPLKHITDQTDAWVILEISGESSREALERICQVDLDKNVFQLDGMARTSMEHMSAIIISKADDTFYLMSASSSAKSFLHAVELSAQHVS